MKITNEKKNARLHFFHDRPTCLMCGKEEKHFVQDAYSLSGRFDCQAPISLAQMMAYKEACQGLTGK